MQHHTTKHNTVHKSIINMYTKHIKKIYFDKFKYVAKMSFSAPHHNTNFSLYINRSFARQIGQNDSPSVPTIRLMIYLLVLLAFNLSFFRPHDTTHDTYTHRHILLPLQVDIQLSILNYAKFTIMLFSFSL